MALVSMTKGYMSSLILQTLKVAISISLMLWKFKKNEFFNNGSDYIL
jgi:hypothetical protein